MTEESRQNLNKYYKYVEECKSCNKKYGTDLKDKFKRCPICIERLKRFDIKKREVLNE
jgi:hypothetical protein